VSGHFVSRVVSGWVGSDIGSSSVRSFRVSGCIRSGRVSGHFGFRVVSGRVGSGIGSSSVGSFRVSGRIKSGRIGYQVVQCRVISGYGSYRVRTGRADFSGRVLPPLDRNTLIYIYKE
jgi:hypothetical protein